jgi:hypothetical protein
MNTANGNPRPNPAAYTQIARLFQLISTPDNLDMTWGNESGAYLGQYYQYITES